MDGIFPALLLRTEDFWYLTGYCYVPATWRQLKLVFIPKPGMSSCTRPRDFRPFSLTSLLLKTIQRLVDKGRGLWLWCHCIPTNMLTRLRNPCKRPFISSWFGLRRCSTSMKQLWVC